MDCIKYNLAGIQIIFGEDALKELKNELDRLQVKRPLLVTDQGIVEAGILKTIKDYLYIQEIAYEVYNDVKSDPIDQMVFDGTKLFKEKECDCVISVGGGSSMDTGKCISIMSVHEGKILDYARSTPNHKNFVKKGCPIISIPTTSGTGSEVSQYAVITNALTHRKTTIATPYILSDVAILNPLFTLTMPKEITAYTGMDALAHAVDAYTYKTTLEHEVKISDICAMEAIKLIGQNLVTAYEQPCHIQSRKNMMWAALLAGIALNVGAGESHAFGSMLSKYYGVPHGVSVGIPLPYCMEYNLKTCVKRYADIANALGCNQIGTDYHIAKAGIEKIKSMMENLNFPKMKDYIKEISEVEYFAEECANNSCCVSNGRMNNKEAIIEVFKEALEA